MPCLVKLALRSAVMWVIVWPDGKVARRTHSDDFRRVSGSFFSRSGGLAICPLTYLLCRTCSPIFRYVGVGVRCCCGICADSWHLRPTNWPSQARPSTKCCCCRCRCTAPRPPPLDRPTGITDATQGGVEEEQEEPFNPVA
ncbi:hypothetical protein LZ30DRAFT_216086 [Colletotrichum cereale]|nr:hypothetical protein LZ30DRAFT_216086 [Colletotrichum cereale]